MRVRPVAELKTNDLERWFHGLVPATEDREAQRRAKATAERILASAIPGCRTNLDGLYRECVSAGFSLMGSTGIEPPAV